jgi:hypothetical protein
MRQNKMRVRDAGKLKDTPHSGEIIESLHKASITEIIK